MKNENVSLELLFKLCKDTFDETRSLRKSISETTLLLTQIYEYTKRIERNHVELRNDLELTIRMELGGSLANIHTLLDEKISKIEESVENLTEHVNSHMP